MYFRGTKNTPCTTAVLVSYVATGSRQTNKCRYCCLCPFRTMSLLDFVGGTQASALETRGLSRRHMEAAESCERHLLFLKIKVRVFVRMYLYKLQRRVNLHACLQPKPGSGNTNNSYTHSYTRLHAWIEPSSRPQARTRTCNNTNHRNVDGSPSPPGMQTCCQMLMVLPAPQGCKRVAGNAFLRCDDVQQLSPMVN